MSNNPRDDLAELFGRSVSTVSTFKPEPISMHGLLRTLRESESIPMTEADVRRIVSEEIRYELDRRSILDDYYRLTGRRPCAPPSNPKPIASPPHSA